MVGLPNSQTPAPVISNAALAEGLERQADRIAERDDNRFHIIAYRRAAETLRSLSQPVTEILDRQGRAGLEQLPWIGKSLAQRIQRMVQKAIKAGGEEGAAEQLFTTIGDIGPELARRIQRYLMISTLSELQAAAYDGRLAKVPGIGGKRLRAVREALAARGARVSRSGDPSAGGELAAKEADPPIDVLLEIDRQYRELAAEDSLPKIAPQRFNPTRDAWLPILRTEHNGQRDTALFSNTSHAHALGMTRDWVVIYCETTQRGPWTVITAQFGTFHGRRLVRGREKECAALYGHK